MNGNAPIGGLLLDDTLRPGDPFLVQDAAYMVTVPFFCPDVPILRNNPAFFYYPDRFQKPNPFKPDVIVSVDEVMEKKLDALAVMESQFYEGGANGSADLMPSDRRNTDP